MRINRHEYHSARRNTGSPDPTGYQLLAAGMIRQAIEDLLTWKAARRPDQEVIENARDADAWLRGLKRLVRTASKPYGVSFDDVCTGLNIDKEIINSQIAKSFTEHDREKLWTQSRLE